MKRILALAVVVVAALAGPAAVAHGDTYTEGSLCQERPSCASTRTTRSANGVHRPRRADRAVHLQPAGHGRRRPDVHDHAAEEPAGAAEPGRHRRHLGLPAAARRSGSASRCATPSPSPNFRRRARRTATRTRASAAPTRSRRTTSASRPATRSWSCSSTRPAGCRSSPASAAAPRKWCANLTIDSLSDQDNTGVPQNADCLNNHFLVGEEPINWAYITKSGKSQAPANPLALSDDPNLTGLNPDLSKDLLMNPGDTLRIHMHDTPAGYRVDITDLTTGQHGSMTASIANGFGHVLFEPNAKTCHVAPYAFHPMYSLGGPARHDVGRAHHQRRRLGRDRPLRVLQRDRPATGACTKPGAGDTTLDDDDQACLDGSQLRRADPDHRLRARRRRLRRAVLPARLARDVREPARGRAGARDAGAVHACRRRTASRSSRSSFENDLPRIERGEPGNAAARSATAPPARTA